MVVRKILNNTYDILYYYFFNNIINMFYFTKDRFCLLLYLIPFKIDGGIFKS